MDNLEEDEQSFLENVPLAENYKRRTVVGPWKNLAEFNQVFQWIFGDGFTTTTRQLALQQIRIWNLRRSSLCPAAVLATSVIVEVLLKDDSATTNYSSEDLQNLYANAFTRFFNFMSSIMQTHNMKTMYHTAKELGLQSFVVDLRHICAHGQALPPLEVLRNAAEYCLHWLHDYYWNSQLSSMCDVDATRIRRKDKTAFDENVSGLCEIFDSALEGYIKGANNCKNLKRHIHGKRYQAVMDYCSQQTALNDLKEIFDKIVKDLFALVKRDVAIKDISEIYIEALLKMRYFFNVQADVSRNPEQLEKLFAVVQTLFRMLAVFGFLEDFFLSLLEIAENPIAKATKREGASFWAVEIIKGFIAFRVCKRMYKAELDANSYIKETNISNSNLGQISNGTLELLIYGGVDIKQTLIFADHFRRPWVWVFKRSFLEQRLQLINEYTQPILLNILPLIVPELSTADNKALSSLINSYVSKSLNDENNELAFSKETEVQKIFTANDLLQKINKTMEVDVDDDDDDAKDDLICDINETTKSYGIWSEVPDDDCQNWKLCPLGRLPWE